MKEHREVVIYPLLREHIERIFQGKDVFCKYVGRGIPSIEVEDKLLFYASGSRGEVLGEATIKAIEFFTPEEIISKYEDRLFVTKNELDDYRRRRNRPLDKKLMVLSLSNITRYEKPFRTLKSLTMAGQTLSKTEYKKLLSG